MLVYPPWRVFVFFCSSFLPVPIPRTLECLFLVLSTLGFVGVAREKFLYILFTLFSLLTFKMSSLFALPYRVFEFLWDLSMRLERHGSHQRGLPAYPETWFRIRDVPNPARVLRTALAVYIFQRLIAI